MSMWVACRVGSRGGIVQSSHCPFDRRKPCNFNRDGLLIRTLGSEPPCGAVPNVLNSELTRHSQ
jgi:hypothetical protein